MEFSILGPLRVVDVGRQVAVPRMLRTLLVVLLVHRGHVVSVERLADELWGDSRPQRSLDTVRAHVRNLRDLFGARPGSDTFELVTVRGGGYRLAVDPAAVDADRFVELSNRGMELVEHEDYQQATAVLSEALQLWRGPPVPELEGRPAAIELVGRLESVRRRARIARVAADLAVGRDRHAVDELEQLVHECPTHERLRYWWALATYRTAGVAPAAEICRAGIVRLTRCGVDVGELRDLQQRILLRDPGLMPTESAPIFQLEHASSPTFVGRLGQLAEIESLLGRRRGLSAPGAVAIHGLGGVGKSRLAIEYCYLHAHEYEVVCWIPANDEASIISRLSTLARRLGVPDSVPQEAIVPRTWEALRGRGRWLLVYDDAGDSTDLEPYWPRATAGHVLVTSRNPAWGARAAPYLLRPLALDDAIDFFSPHAAKDDDSAATELAKALGTLPLAMELARAYMEQTRTSIRDYLFRLGEHTAVILGVTALGSTSSVAGTWLVALETLRTQAIEAEQLLSLFAFLGPVAFPRSNLVGQRDQLPDPLGQALADPISGDRIIAALARYSLAIVSPDTIEVHVLLQATVRLLLPADLRDRWHRAAIRLVAAGLPPDARDARDMAVWPVLASLYPHTQAVLADPRSAVLEPLRTARLATAAARYSRALGDLRKAADLYYRAVTLLDDQGLGGKADTADVLMERGLVRRDLGHYDDAAIDFSRAFRVRETLFGRSSAEVSDALTMIGLVLFDQGDLTSALTSLDTAATIQQSLLDVDERLLARTAGVRGLVLWRMNKLNEARVSLARALTLRESQVGSEHPDVAIAMDNLAKVVLDQGDLDEALALNERALRIRVTKLGPTHLHTAIGLNHLGYVQRELGRLDAAIDSHERALAMFRDLFGSEHSHVARSLAAIGLVLLRQNRFPEASDKLRAAHASFTETLGPNHYETAICLGQLGQAMLGSGDIDGGRAATERALGLLADSPAYPQDHPEINRLRQQLDRIQRA